MSTLFRFEDKYGIHSIFKSMNSFDYSSVKGMSSTYDAGSCFVEYGLGNGDIFKTSKFKSDMYKKLGITRIVFIFDTDRTDGRVDDILDIQSLRDKIDVFANHCRNRNFNVKCEFCLVVYCSETILLYQYIESLSHDVEELVRQDVCKFHLQLLSGQTGVHQSDVKNSILDYLNVKALKNGISSKVKSSINSDIHDWILHDCVTSSKFQTDEEVINKLQDAHMLYLKALNNSIELHIVDSHNNSSVIRTI